MQSMPDDETKSALVVGGRGGIGAAIAARLGVDYDRVERTSRSPGDGVGPGGDDARVLTYDPLAPDFPAQPEMVEAVGPYHAVVWAQGTNVNDTPATLDPVAHREVLEANVLFVTLSLAHLVQRELLVPGARLCVLSSIWQEAARPGKFSYTVSKAAIAGVVRAAAADLAEQGILVNAVLPGVVDTPMTRGVLSDAQVAAVEGATGFGRLTTLADVAETVAWLCSPANSGVTGQSIAVDLGFSFTHVL